MWGGVIPTWGIDVGIDVGIVIGMDVGIDGDRWLDQTELGCPFDGCLATIDVEFTEDVLGMGADGAQADHEFLGDLWPRKLAF